MVWQKSVAYVSGIKWWHIAPISCRNALKNICFPMMTIFNPLQSSCHGCPHNNHIHCHVLKLLQSGVAVHDVEQNNDELLVNALILVPQHCTSHDSSRHKFLFSVIFSVMWVNVIWKFVGHNLKLWGQRFSRLDDDTVNNSLFRVTVIQLCVNSTWLWSAINACYNPVQKK